MHRWLVYTLNNIVPCHFTSTFSYSRLFRFIFVFYVPMPCYSLPISSNFTCLSDYLTSEILLFLTLIPQHICPLLSRYIHTLLIRWPGSLSMAWSYLPFINLPFAHIIYSILLLFYYYHFDSDRHTTEKSKMLLRKYIFTMQYTTNCIKAEESIKTEFSTTQLKNTYRRTNEQTT